ncbi:hypothetical protein [Loktanella sp. S4079]|uniref:hypothetical protein n=1 Tax=Loktanella sp. S4079 TaxID=579483 RepID=UPI0005F9F82B|nr:hypothetical protein [Loktanella sp. S4079]KJZ19284.1 hypothetical protein TW80_10885 [Loktanella sp. S4079]
MRLPALALIVFNMLIGTAAPAEETGDFSMGLGVSNFGVALTGEYTTSPQWNIRGVVMGGFSFDDTFQEDDYTIVGRAELGGVALFADYYPLDNAWRMTGGVFMSNSELTGDFTGPENFTGDMGFANELVPMIATGFKAQVSDTVSFYGDVGVMFSSLEVSSDSTDPAVQTEIDELNDDLDDMPVFPYIETGVSFRF